MGNFNTGEEELARAAQNAENTVRESEAQFRSMFEIASIGMAQVDVQTGLWLRVNQEMCMITGYTAEELLKARFSDLTHPEERQKDWEEFQRVVRGEVPDYPSEKRYVRKDGSLVWVKVIVTINRDAAGQPVRAMAVIEDITERQRAEEALRASEARLKFALERIHAGAWELDLLDLSAHRTLIHDRIFGYETLLPQWNYEIFLEHVLPEDRQYVDECFREATAAQSDWRFECRIRRADGEVRWILAAGRQVRNPEGQPVRIAGIVQDITERKQAEERIAQLSHVQTILAGINSAIVHIADRQKLLDEICRVAVEKGDFKLAWIGMVSPDGSVQPVAKAGEIAYLDGTRVLIRDDEPEGRGPVGTAIRENRPVEIVDIERDERMTPWRARALELGLRYAVVFPLCVEGKAVGSFQVYATRAGLFDEKELGLLSQVSEDISFALRAIEDATIRKLAEDELRQSEKKYKDLFENSRDALVTTEPSSVRFTSGNPAALQMFGVNDEKAFTSYSPADLSPDRQPDGRLSAEKAREMVEQTMREGSHFFEWTHRRMNGEEFFSDVRLTRIERNGKPAIMATIRDITERRRLEQEVLEISAREQRHIGQELHDNICQSLAGTEMLSSLLSRELAEESSPKALRAKEITDYLHDTLAAVRMLAHGLAPGMIDSEGLTESLRQLAANAEGMFHIRCLCDCPDAVKVRNQHAGLHIYRIAQEAISNAVRHGGAREVAIRVRSHEDRVSMLIRDDGCGIAQPIPKTLGMGLRTMSYRSGIIGATLEIRPGTHGGTEIVCTFPKDL